MGYIFPLLTCDEIVQVLKNSDKFPDVTVDVLQKPQNYVTVSVTEQYYENQINGVTVGTTAGASSSSAPNFHQTPAGILDIYIAFWEFLTSTSDIRRMPWHELLTNDNSTGSGVGGGNVTNFPTLYEDATRFLCVFRTIQHLANIAGIGDFSLNDIVKPEGKRLRRNLSALINFCRFREDESQNEHEQQRVVEELDLRIATTSEAMRSLKENVDQQEAELAQEKAAVERYLSEERTIKQEMERLNIFQIEAAMDDAKRDTSSTNERMENAAGEIRMLEDAITAMKKGVISDMDPAQLVSDVKKLREASQRKTERIKILQQSCDKLGEETAKAETGTARCNLFLDRVREHQQTVEKSHKQELESDSLQQELEENRQEYQTSEREEREARDKIVTLSAKIEEVAFQKQREREQVAAEMRVLEDRIQEAQQELDKENAQVRENVEVNEVEKALEKLHDERETSRLQWQTWHEKLDLAILQYEQELSLGIEDEVPAMIPVA
ncbi:unnamed protein product [Amoebophrya sp. A120]|nr:unnamed protein product [Amoebophrya sp. A120]|eukprot:GSA120T00017635001.1